MKRFKDRRTEDVFSGRVSKGMAPELVRQAQRKLRILAAAEQLETLRSPPGNHLEALAGARRGEWSIRINRQWRLCFRWDNTAGHAYDMSLEDYH